MDALVSGQAGRVAFLYGNNVKVTGVDGLEGSSEVPISSLGHLFAGTTDVQKHSVSSEKEGIYHLRIAEQQDRALLLAILLLSNSEEEGFRKEAAGLLSELLTESKVLKFLNFRFYSSPIDEMGDLDGALSYCNDHDAVCNWLRQIKDHQSCISLCCYAWNNVDDNLFDGKHATKEIAASIVTELGLFYSIGIAVAQNDRHAFDTAKLNALMARPFAQLPRSREILSAWLSSLTPDASESMKLRHAAIDAQTRKTKDKRPSPRFNSASTHERYENVTRQIEEIKKLLRLQEVPKARKFSQDLAKLQLQAGDKAYAAQSLCNIGSYALDVSQDSFALEMAKQAIEINPEDARSWGQLADAFIHLKQFDFAREALSEADKWGEHLFAENGRGRLLKHQGFISEARDVFKSVVEKYKLLPEVWQSYLNLGDTHRDLGEFDEALEVFSTAIEKYPDQSRLRCGLAFTLTVIGRLDEAVTVFKAAIDLSAPIVMSYVGLAQTYLEMGRVDQAVYISREGYKRFRDEPTSFRQYGECLLAKKQYVDAIKIFNRMKSEYPYDYTGFKGVAEAFREQRQFNKAIKAYEYGMSQFPYEVSLYLRHASLLKELGDFDGSLRAYSEARDKFPTNTAAKFGQANLFKELGYFDRAIDLYAEIEDERAAYKPDAAIAAIHVVKNEFPQALELISINAPTTKGEWVAYHVKGMALLKSGLVDDAIALFKKGVNEVPFNDQRPYYSTALTLSEMKGNKHKDTLKSIPNDLGPLSNVLNLHIYARVNNIDMATKAYASLQSECPNNIIPLRDELAAQLQLSDSSPQHDSDWIFEQECNAVALAVTQQQAA